VGIFQGDNIFCGLYKSRTMLEKTLLAEMTVDKKKLLKSTNVFPSIGKGAWSKSRGLLNLTFRQPI